MTRQHPVHAAADAEVLPRSVRIAEGVAGFMGTTRYLIIQSVFVLSWIAYNGLLAAGALRFDPYPFILLNLAFSTQASYAAPLILLAQGRQAKLDRARADHDHEASEENLRLTRELHARLAVEA